MKVNNCLPPVLKWTHQMLQLELNLKACSETKPFTFFTVDIKLVTPYAGGISGRNGRPRSIEHTVLLMMVKQLAISYEGDGRKEGTI